MDFSKGVVLLVLTLVSGFAAFSVFDPRLAILFALLWVDKTVISAFGAIRYFGVELTTVTSVILATLYGPFFAFIFLIVLIPVLHGLKYILLPLPTPEWPLFVPSPYNIVDAVGALVAGLLVPLSFFINLLVTAVSKDILFAFAARLTMSKPVNVLSAITSVVFNMFVGYPFGLFILGLL
jgi:hypothetical protein